MTRTESVIVELPENSHFLSEQVLLAGGADPREKRYLPTSLLICLFMSG